MPPLRRAAQAPAGAPPPKIVAPPPPPPAPPPKIVTPPRMTPAPEPEAAAPATARPGATAEPAIFRHLADKPRESRLILLSRTLAGLVDLIIVIICGSAFIFMVDVLEGISVFDRVSVSHYVLLLLLTYFVYSMFFLSTGTQTIGMMLTYLHVTGADTNRPKIIRILLRCIFFLLGLAALGIGLLWGCFDRQARCLHDRLSSTRVERISP